MPSRSIIRSIVTLAAFFGVSSAAHAGIIVTVGKPCPDATLSNKKPTAEQQRPTYEGTTTQTEGTRCVVTPDGQTKCGRAIRVETVSALPSDWRCIQVARSVLWCETPPAYGAAPGAAGSGEFDPSELEESEDSLDDEEMQALGCSGGAGIGGLAGIGGVLLLLVSRRRRV